MGAPSKGIAKVGMWVTDTSISTEYDPSLSRMCWDKWKKMTVSNAPVITISRRITILNTLKAWQTISMPRFTLKYAEDTYIHQCNPCFRSQSVKGYHKDYDYKKLRTDIKGQFCRKIPPMAIPRSTQISAVRPAARRILKSMSTKPEQKRNWLRNAYLLAKTYERSQIIS